MLRFEGPTLSGGENVAGDVLHGNAGVSVSGECPDCVESGGAGLDVVARRVAVRLLRVGIKVLCIGGVLLFPRAAGVVVVPPRMRKVLDVR